MLQYFDCNSDEEGEPPPDDKKISSETGFASAYSEGDFGVSNLKTRGFKASRLVLLDTDRIEGSDAAERDRFGLMQEFKLYVLIGEETESSALERILSLADLPLKSADDYFREMKYRDDTFITEISDWNVIVNP